LLENLTVSSEQPCPTVFSNAEDEVLAQTACHDREAFAELYRRYVRPIYSFHLARAGSAVDAEDLTSQTFLAAIENIDRYAGQGTVCGWLFGIARYKAADHYRRKRTAFPLERAEVIADPDPSPEEKTEARFDLDRVAQALRVLSPEQAEALTLRIFGGLSSANAGKAMGKSAAAVRMLVYRGLNRLQAELKLNQEVAR
jgi:RNA polymerase sigma-70 factor (ECF subfamily)